MIIRPFEVGDIRRVLVKDAQLTEWVEAQSNEHDLANTYAFTLVHDGEVIACAGMIPKYYGIAEVWAMFSDRTGEFKLSIIKAMRKHIKLIKECGTHYLMTPVKKSSPEAVRFIEAMGFQKSGELNKYLWKEDYWLYTQYLGED